MTAVLNGQRQVVYANSAFRALVRAEDVRGLCGDRPGEILGCIHSAEDARGCGESESCRFCGAFQAISEALRTDRPCCRECHISAAKEGSGVAYDLRVQASPFVIGGGTYVLVGFTDISGQKRRLALERIFFHDLLNTASSLMVYLDLLSRGISDDGNRTLLDRLKLIAETLVEEIQGQKLLVAAENGTLRVQRCLIESRAVIEQLIGQLAGQEFAAGKSISIEPFSEALAFVSDDSLIRRILTNMLKNALEASPPGAAVTIGSRASGRRIEFRVSNPGCMDEEVRSRVFQRYFSTKGSDRGLGTYGMKLLAENYLEGSVSFESTPDTGTVFLLSLPMRPSQL